MPRVRTADHGQVPDEKVVEPGPDGGYGWVCVVAVALVNAHTWGINSAYGVFLSHYLANDTFPGASALDYAFVGGLSISIAFLLSPLATYSIHRLGTRATLLIGVFFETVALIGASFATAVWHLFLSQGVCFGLGMGFMFVGTVGVISQWFTTRRSFANAIGVAGSGIGGLVYSLAAGAMIRSVGLAWAFRVLGLVALVVNLACAMVIRDRNGAIGSSQLSFDHRLFARKEYLMLQAWGFFSVLGYIVLLFSLPNYAISIGLSASEASIVGALLNLGQGLGRPLVGIFSDRVGRINVAAGLSFLCGLFCLVFWIFATGYGTLLFFAVLIGTMAGIFWTSVAPVSAEVVGLKDLPSALSTTWLVLVLPTTFSEPIALMLRRATGNIYLHVQIYTGLMYMAATASLWGVRAWKIGELERIAAERHVPVDAVDAIDPGQTVPPEDRSSPGRPSSGVARRPWGWRKV